MVEFLVRAGAMRDVPGVVALERATEMLPHWAAAQYAIAVSQVDGSLRRCLFVAEVAGELVGFAVGMVAGGGGDEATAELESVAVAASARRMGVAKALCGAVIEWARLHGTKEMELEVRSGSSEAIRLYEELGFVAVGRRPEYYKVPADDAVLMRLKT